VEEFIKEKPRKTSEVIRFGLSIYHTRADRDARDLAGEGKIERMSKDDTDFYYPGINEEVWKWKTQS
jgi:hypothetical protein